MPHDDLYRMVSTAHDQLAARSPHADDEDDESPVAHGRNPKVLVPRSKDYRETDLVSRLLQNRTIYLGTEIDNRCANNIVQQFICLQLDDETKPITLYINSPGGSIVDGMAIYDVIKRAKCPVKAIVAGMAASMGAVILSGCTKGERYSLPHGEVLLHQPLGGARGQATDVEISANRILKMKRRLLTILAENTGHTYEKLVEDCDRDYWLDADEALAYGIVDHLL
jgi:ATP-dependent Clp protease protease subunit